MKKTIIRYGVYGALTICLLSLLGWFAGDNLDYSTKEVIGYASMVVSLSFVYFGIKHFRDKQNGGKISFKKALTIGVLISVITALIFGILDIIYVEYLNPGFMDDYYNHSIEQMKSTLPTAEYEAKVAELEAQKEMFMNPLFTFIVMGMTVFVIGFIISLVSALLLQRK
ncbi:DUF4199 domain-containing protein [Flagellimonas lutaonensis]|uniref:DUF4199 domain-containing protein n=1 Tax=Flagellimonas lutaonensis TaxID=516051 RepID=A0A0D5YSQ9_9FLAO|nr:DUF4199 domain-containing protein [Allomuricauda lutaonensis]AKA35295.1 hypothetical protein VC82_1682 [Allomuricauda lutaonensis]